MKTTSYLFKMYRNTSLVLLFSVVSTVLFAQNIGINTTGATPSQNAILDLSTGNTHNMGLLIPRVALGASLNTYSPPMAYAATGKDSGMMVYNWVATNQPIGYYWWSGTTWVSVTGTAWNVTGNAGTTPGVNYAGTSDAQDFVIKTNATERMRILSTGNAGINAAPIATQILTVSQNNAANVAIMGQNTAAAGTNNGIGVYGVSSQAYAAGPLNGYGVVALNNNTNGTGLYAAGNNLGINSSILTGGAGATMAGAVGGYGYSPFGNGAGFYGQATGATSTGIIGVGDNATPTTDANGSGGAFSGTLDGAFGFASTAASGVGMIGVGNNLGSHTVPTNGSGGAFTGSSVGDFGYSTNAAAGVGVLGEGNDIAGGTVPGAGSGGAFDGTTIGAFGFATTAGTGNGVVGVGNNGAYYTSGTGAGGAFTGTNTGVYATTTGTAASGMTSGLNAGVTGAGTYGLVGIGTTGGLVCDNITTGNIVYVDYWNGTNYKIMGTSPGTVTMSVQDTKGNYVLMHAPETPECYFEDYGEGQLTNGKTHIDLDPTIAKNICVNGKHPLRVFIQLEGNCKGVYVTNKSANGFDVVELDGGTSNTSFEYHIIANEADAVMPSGVVSKFADLRFEPTPANAILTQQTIQKTVNTQNIIQPAGSSGSTATTTQNSAAQKDK